MPTRQSWQLPFRTWKDSGSGRVAQACFDGGQQEFNKPMYILVTRRISDNV
jgi:hypothetical protein